MKEKKDSQTSTSCLEIDFKVEWKRMNIKLNNSTHLHICVSEWYDYTFIVVAAADADASSQFIKKETFFKCVQFLENDWQLLSIVVPTFS